MHYYYFFFVQAACIIIEPPCGLAGLSSTLRNQWSRCCTRPVRLCPLLAQAHANQARVCSRSNPPNPSAAAVCTCRLSCFVCFGDFCFFSLCVHHRSLPPGGVSPFRTGQYKPPAQGVRRHHGMCRSPPRELGDPERRRPDRSRRHVCGARTSICKIRTS